MIHKLKETAEAVSFLLHFYQITAIITKHICAKFEEVPIWN